MIRLPFFLNVSFFFKESYFLLSYNISRHALRVYGQHVKSKMADQNEEDTSPAADIVVTKYKMAGDMVNGEGKINLISSLRIFSLIETRYSYLFIVHSTYKRALVNVPCWLTHMCDCTTRHNQCKMLIMFRTIFPFN